MLCVGPNSQAYILLSTTQGARSGLRTASSLGSQDPSTLPLGELIQYVWEAKRQQGSIFKTSVEGAETRHSVGKTTPWAVELFRNPGRASKPTTMKAQDVDKVSLPFNDGKFHFLQAATHGKDTLGLCGLFSVPMYPPT